MPPPQPHSGPPAAAPTGRGHAPALAGIVLVAAGLRLYQLGRPSLWYDEVIPMRLARQEGPAALLRLLRQIEATRAPLHPLVLQGWLRIFGPSDLSGRALAALCGILTILLVDRIGRRLYDGPTGLWGAWLCAVGPLLVAYSREVKMYSWLVLLTCLSWDLLFSLRASAASWRAPALGLCQAALIYSHPLGAFMVAAQGLAYLATRATFRLTTGRWLAVQSGVVLAVAPWVGHYLDHPPEFTLARLPLKYLLGLPIGFIGGDSRALCACAGLVALGLVVLGRREDGARRARLDHPEASVPLLIWFAVPPTLLYAYSWVSYPIFGPARYTLFVGPAYLLLVARGLVKLPAAARYPAALVGLVLAARLLSTMAYAPDLKADWRAAAAFLRGRDRAPIVVISADPAVNREVETARYYLGPSEEVVPAETASDDLLRRPVPPRAIWAAVGLRGGHPVAPIPGPVRRDWPGEAGRFDFPGLRLYRLRRDP
jgi:mannosyltransferase